MREETVREQGPPLDGVGRNDLESTILHRRGDTSSEIWGGLGKCVWIDKNEVILGGKSRNNTTF